MHSFTVCVLCACCRCAPLVACVDQAITLSASGQQKLWPTLVSKLQEIVKEPVKFFSSAAFLWLWFVYSLTYAVANSASTISRAPTWRRPPRAAHSPAGPPPPPHARGSRTSAPRAPSARRPRARYTRLSS